MQPGDLFFQGVVALFSVYIAVTGTLAEGVRGSLEYFGWYTDDSPEIVELVEEEFLMPPPSASQSSPNFARILLDNLAYQEAAVISTTQASRTEGSEATIEDALVNIICTYKAGNETRTTTGSGAFIDAQGVILTNAHVAQFLLLPGATCRIRQGSPARDRYEANLLYLSPLWVGAHAGEIDTPNPSMTGEHDYALLFVTEAVAGELPDTFPSLRFDAALQDADNLRELRAAGYPGTTFGIGGPSTSLTSAVSSTTLVRRFTFGSGAFDLIGLRGSSVGEYGSSGGPVVNGQGVMVGLIVTLSNPERDGERSLRALTLSYIDAAIKAEAGFDLKTMLKGDIGNRAAIFKDALAPALTQILSSAAN